LVLVSLLLFCGGRKEDKTFIITVVRISLYPSYPMPGVWKLLSAATFFFLVSIGFCSPGSSFGLLLLAAAKLSAGGGLEWQPMIPGMANHGLLWREQEGE
jgi:hypothetical protein